MRVKDLIEKKKNGEALTDNELRCLIEGYTKGEIPDYQMSAFAMAVCFRGMDFEETKVMTDAMMRSGDVVDLSLFGDTTVDKHSTGGVGDKTSLIIGPVAAALGCTVAKMSGRGLGHTGGTVDKLESIEGFETELSTERFYELVKETGIAVVGQSTELAPADKKLYSLRDATSTVNSIPLIASSIMSKKLAAGAKSIVLDVKTGSGAFMKDYESAAELARTMVEIGKALGRNMCALITDMDTPLGYAVGNSLEVKEAVAVLKGEDIPDLRKVCVALASSMVSLGKNISLAHAEKLVSEAIDSGAAFEKLKEWIGAQGGNTALLDDPTLFPEAPFKYEVKADREGYVFSMDAENIGNAACTLGAGRLRKDDPIDYSAGIVLKAKTGDYVKCGDTLAVFYTSERSFIEGAEALYRSAVVIGENKPEVTKLILGEVR
ncbi:MAG: thymidine phosphorylase [Ruminococcaceae bacterium]|nr:thymidine phosphorylase [Oscillospiraceae bacterium]